MTGIRIRASAAAVIALAIVAALFANDRPGPARLLPPGPVLDEIRGAGIAANDAATPAYRPIEQFARPQP